MFELNGKYGTAKVFTDICDETAVSQIIELMNQPMSEGQRVRIMPDVHAGAGCTVGTTMTITDKAVPNLVGVDIGCGMETVKLKEKHIEVQQLDKLIYREIPSGFDIRKKPHRFNNKIDLTELYCYDHIDHDKAIHSLGSLGGGNHFIEADKGSDGGVYIVIHSGSRHLGLEVAKFYQEEAYKRLNGCAKPDIDELVARLKEEGRDKQIQTEITKLKNTKRTDVPKQLAYTEGELFEQYIHDMKIVQQFAMLNRQAMMDEIIDGMSLHVKEQFTTIHNYIDTNMRDGSLICTGKGNPDWNYSAPHGAGRILSRSAAKAQLTLTEFKREMKGIYSTSVSSSTLDESPMAYKSIDDIVGNIGDTCEIEDIIKPIYNFKAGEEEGHGRSRMR